MKYVILRSLESEPAGRFGNRRRGPGAAKTAKAKPKIDVDDLSPKKAAELRQKKEVKALAPAMPMKLIAPTARKKGPAAKAAAGTVAWGVKAVGADTSPFSGNGIVVAVLDTGIDATHPAFSGVKLVQKNFTSASASDQDGHGTHCAGTIFGRDVNGMRIGVARGIKKALIGKVLGKGGGGSDTIAEAIQWAVDNGAQIISMSLGIDFPGFVKVLEGDGFPTELATSIALEGYRQNVALFDSLASFLEAQGAFGNSALLVAAAGNESQRDVDPEFEIAVSPPAVANGFVSVAALGESPNGFSIADFSNTGAKLSGPGVDIISAKRGGGLISFNGTSMATPHVAGVAALWAEKLNAQASLNVSQLVSRLIGNATLNGIGSGFDPLDVGAGMVQAPQN